MVVVVEERESGLSDLELGGRVVAVEEREKRGDLFEVEGIGSKDRWVENHAGLLVG